jgi:hypothetical protein
MIHNQFDIEYWKKRIPLSELQREGGEDLIKSMIKKELYPHATDSELDELDIRLECCAYSISNPLDAAISVQLHESILKKVPLSHTATCDIIVWSWGEGSDLRRSRVGGRPVWPKGVAWPKGRKGKPMKFLCQICFADSLDILPELPGDLLVVLSEDGEDSLFPDRFDKSYNERGMNFQSRNGYIWQCYWLKLSDDLQVIDHPLVRSEHAPVHGSLFRFNEAFEYDGSTENIVIPDWAVSLGAYQLFPMQATKIGGDPPWIQGVDKPDGYQFIGTICSYFFTHAFPNAPVGWLGKYTDLNLGDQGIINLFYNKNNGFIDSFINPNGKVIGRLQYH